MPRTLAALTILLALTLGGFAAPVAGAQEATPAVGNDRLLADTMGLPRKRVDEILELVSLTPTEAKRRVRNYSLGMRQRLAVERALLHEPRLVLLDEPFTGLDDAATVTLQQRLSGLREQGCIVILTTHDLETIEPIASRAVMLRNGRLVTVQQGAGSLRERYRQLSAPPQEENRVTPATEDRE